MEIEVVICKSSHGTHERNELYKELKDADIFVPEFFCSSMLKIVYFDPSHIPIKKIKEAFEKAKKENKKLKVLEDEEAEKFFLSQFENLDNAESQIRRMLYSYAFILP